MMKYLYYPGCSLKGQATPYEKSLLASFEKLGIVLEELPDWNCCGATTYMGVDNKAALALAARNLAIAEDLEQDVIAPCSACYMILNKAQHQVNEYPEMGKTIRAALANAGLKLHGKRIRVRHPLEVLVNDFGVQEIKKRVSRPLSGLKIFPYYGCLIVRPKTNAFDDPWYPTTMDRLLEALGCKPVDHALKTKCCGGSLTGTIEEVGLRLVYHLLHEAKKKEVKAIAALCPLCQFNLEAYQKKVEKQYRETFRLPVLYFTQLLGYAVGIEPEDLGFSQLIVPANEVLKGAEVKDEEGK
ncbi:MAG: CoB--CoM heterodisulfide reductase iron-sulfur subunit B family protein [Calditrichaceae bacterium]|nr:CoB--CoM heterodisulfide reductase iron-sulfur subunit B family protein [Calditrichia bacterium]NUQ39840.1 CoB--CoM heterodisulfide reductase iron-sulfur subunit B family protein [Calditrichaceae bacterium]